MFPEMRDSFSHAGDDENTNALFYQFLNEPTGDFASDSPASFVSSPQLPVAESKPRNSKPSKAFNAEINANSQSGSITSTAANAGYTAFNNATTNANANANANVNANVNANAVNSGFADLAGFDHTYGYHTNTMNHGLSHSNLSNEFSHISINATPHDAVTGSRDPVANVHNTNAIHQTAHATNATNANAHVASVRSLESNFDFAEFGFADASNFRVPNGYYNPESHTNRHNGFGHGDLGGAFADEFMAIPDYPSELTATPTDLLDPLESDSFADPVAPTAGPKSALSAQLAQLGHIPPETTWPDDDRSINSARMTELDSEPLSPSAAPPAFLSSSFNENISRKSSTTSLRMLSTSSTAVAPISIAGSRRDSFAGVFKGTPTLRSRQSSVATSGMEYGSDFGQSASLPTRDMQRDVSRSWVPSAVRENSPAPNLATTAPKDDIPRRKPSAASIAGQTETECSNCSTKNTPLWRRNPEGEPLCNACGLFLKLHGETRPLRLKSDVIKKRNRSSNKTKRRTDKPNPESATSPDPARPSPSSSGSSTRPSPTATTTTTTATTAAATSPKTRAPRPAPGLTGSNTLPSSLPNSYGASPLTQFNPNSHWSPVSSPASSVSPTLPEAVPFRQAQSTGSPAVPSSAPSAAFQQRSDLYNQRVRATGFNPVPLAQKAEATTATTNATASASGHSDGKWDWLRIH